MTRLNTSVLFAHTARSFLHGFLFLSGTLFYDGFLATHGTLYTNGFLAVTGTLADYGLLSKTGTLERTVIFFLSAARS